MTDPSAGLKPRLDWVVGAVEESVLKANADAWHQQFGHQWRDLIFRGIHDRLAGVDALQAVERTVRITGLAEDVVIGIWTQAGLLISNAPAYVPRARVPGYSRVKKT